MKNDFYPGTERLQVEANVASKKHGWLRNDLADQIGCCRATLINKLNHPGDFTLDEFCRLCKAIGMKPSSAMTMLMEGK